MLLPAIDTSLINQNLGLYPQQLLPAPILHRDEEERRDQGSKQTYLLLQSLFQCDSSWFGDLKKQGNEPHFRNQRQPKH